MIDLIKTRLAQAILENGREMAGFFAKGKMESYLVTKILLDNEDVENNIIGLKEFTVVKKKQIDLIFCRDLYMEKGKLQTNEIYLAMEFKKWYSFNAIDKFAKEHIKAIKADIHRLKELQGLRPESKIYFILFLVDPAQMVLPLDVKYNYDHNNKFGYDKEVFENRKTKILDYLARGFDISKDMIEYHELGKYRDIMFKLFIAYVEISQNTDVETVFSS